jgi:type II secretory ATPase GspE/PulE/Tfp pilus assembly ATPase PilB-like protein
MINVFLVVVIIVYAVWITILFWVDKDARERENPSREKWNTLVFFTGPVGLGIYLSKQGKTVYRCPKCGKKLNDMKVAVCPHCKEKLTADVAGNVFLDQMRNFDESKFRVMGKNVEALNVIPDSVEKLSSLKALKMIIANAIDQGATDIHLEPENEGVRIRFRLDGVLQEIPGPPKELQGPLVPCVKALSDLDVSERRKPMDGRMQITYHDRRTDIRVSTSPSIHGEKVAMRILDKSDALLDISHLGMGDSLTVKFEKLLGSTQGMILVTGPTGSGKTTTLYAALSNIDASANNIMTIEDPVEYQLDSVTQIPINPRADVTFASGLRSILRQDPDIVMVGEIRDKETAATACQAAITGHLIFSTLHTNDSTGAIVRLLDIGIESYLISSSLLGVLAQRLVRVNCAHCKVKEEPSPELLEEMGIGIEEQMKFYKGKGCKECKFTGYSGRTGIFELFLIDDNIRQMIEARTSAVTLREFAIRSGMTTMLQEGIEKARMGITSLAEITSTVKK